MASGKIWLKDHFTAILTTLVAIQNWHFFGGKIDVVIRGLSDLLSTLGGA